MFTFLSLLFVLIVIFFFTSQKDHFTDVPPTHTVKIPTVPPATALLPGSKEKAAPESAADVVPYTLPGEIPLAPYGQVANMSPLPYQDTTMIKANRQQILSLLEMLKGFLAFEAQHLAEKSDPSIQLPLSNARSDFQVLQNAVDLLNRNPGLQPTMTMTTLNEMSSNLAYLQEQVRLSGSAGALQGPTNQFTEGFTNSEKATLKDLTEFVGRIQGEIIRLSASGTTDPIVSLRVSALTQLKNDVQSIITKLNSKSMQPNEVPILKSDIEKAFPLLGNPSQPLPQIIKTVGLPPGLANILPANLQKDPETTRQIGSLIDKYAEQIINGISASFSVKYTSPNEVGSADSQTEAQHAASSTIDTLGFPSMADLNNVSNAKFAPYDSGSPVTDHLAPKPSDAGRGPSQFDWKQRSKEIEAQVKRRGLEPTDFGIMPEGTKTSSEFSWKGYARMMCTRLQATSDPSLGITCGCPPMDWKGWRIAK
jgi:hypothetical protein